MAVRTKTTEVNISTALINIYFLRVEAQADIIELSENYIIRHI